MRRTKRAAGATAVVAARAWLAEHKVIFRLASVAGPRVVADSKLASSSGHAVSFQQSFERFEAAAVALHEWERVYNERRFSMALKGQTPAEKLAAVLKAA